MVQPAANEQSIEYSIYVHHLPKAKKDKAFELLETTTNMDEAMKKADELYASGEFKKVEVKQKYFDPKNNREIDMVLKTLELKIKKPLSLPVIILLAVACGAASFGLTVFLVGGKPAATEAAEAAGPEAAASPESPADHP